MRFLIQLLRLIFAEKGMEDHNHAVCKGKYTCYPGYNRNNRKQGLHTQKIQLPDIQNRSKEHLLAQEAGKRRQACH
ncbi:hypothetical protein D3C80_1446350 [compost metagenome]